MVRALVSHTRGHRFKSCTAHHEFREVIPILIGIITTRTKRGLKNKNMLRLDYPITRPMQGKGNRLSFTVCFHEAHRFFFYEHSNRGIKA